MKKKVYILISEFDEITLHRGDLPDALIDAANNGLYDIIDITNSQSVMMYSQDGSYVVQDDENFKLR